jgi:toxin ParE1/3/4
MRIEWSQPAVADLQRISEYIEQSRSLEAANRVARVIYDGVQCLRIMPYRGRPGRLKDTPELVVRALPYIVIYQVFNERLLILNIVHSAQRWPS